MQTLHLKIGNINIRGVQQTMSFRSLLIDCIDFISPQTGGLSNADQRKRNRIADILEKLKDEDTIMEMEDADFEELVKCVEGMRWGVRSTLITELEDEINRVKEEKKEREKK